MRRCRADRGTACRARSRHRPGLTAGGGSRRGAFLAGCEVLDGDAGVGEAAVIDHDALADEALDGVGDVPEVDVHARDDAIVRDELRPARSPRNTTRSHERAKPAYSCRRRTGRTSSTAAGRARQRGRRTLTDPGRPVDPDALYVTLSTTSATPRERAPRVQPRRAAGKTRGAATAKEDMSGRHTPPAAAPSSSGPVVEWRRRRLLAAGFSPGLAADLARGHDVDLHVLLDLIDRGCPPSLAARILAPLVPAPTERRSR